MALTPDQLTAIDRHLRKENWLLNEDLIAELTDHYIAGLDDRMAAGMTFDAALREVHTGFGGRKGLLKMEEEYQMQKARRSMMDEWCKVKTFFSGSRLAITLGVFTVLYYLNTDDHYQDTVSSFLAFIGLPVQISLGGAVFAGAIRNWVWYDRGIADKQIAVPSLTPFVRTFGISYGSSALIAITTAHLSGIVWSTLHILTVTLTQTLAIIYMMGIFIAVRCLFIKKAKIA